MIWTLFLLPWNLDICSIFIFITCLLWKIHGCCFNGTLKIIFGPFVWAWIIERTFCKIYIDWLCLQSRFIYDERLFIFVLCMYGLTRLESNSLSSSSRCKNSNEPLLNNTQHCLSWNYVATLLGIFISCPAQFLFISILHIWRFLKITMFRLKYLD